jgi:hypothetical protein
MFNTLTHKHLNHRLCMWCLVHICVKVQLQEDSECGGVGPGFLEAA